MARPNFAAAPLDHESQRDTRTTRRNRREKDRCYGHERWSRPGCRRRGTWPGPPVAPAAPGWCQSGRGRRRCARSDPEVGQSLTLSRQSPARRWRRGRSRSVELPCFPPVDGGQPGCARLSCLASGMPGRFLRPAPALMRVLNEVPSCGTRSSFLLRDPGRRSCPPPPSHSVRRSGSCVSGQLGSYKAARRITL